MVAEVDGCLPPMTPTNVVSTVGHSLPVRHMLMVRPFAFDRSTGQVGHEEASG